MQIPIQEVLNHKKWLGAEIISSVSNMTNEEVHQIAEKAKEQGYYELKIIVNGVTTEPYWLKEMLDNTEKYIDAEAKSLQRNLYGDTNDEFREVVNKFTRELDAARLALFEKHFTPEQIQEFAYHDGSY